VTRSAHPRPVRIAAGLAVALTLVAALPTSSLGTSRHPNPTFAYLTTTVNAPGAIVVPLINSGQTFDGETFEGIPDGIGVVPVGTGQRYIDLYVNFEQSHVPFTGFADFEDSSVQRARLDLKTMQLTKLDEVLPASAGFIRFCSSFMAGPAEGFNGYTMLLNEESNDVIDVPAGATYGADPSITPYRQAGYSVALDVASGAFHPIPVNGRHNHENTVVVPGGWDDTVALSGDDTFTAPSSQLYMTTAASPSAFLGDDGDLWAFRVTAKNGTPVNAADANNGANDYLDITVADTLAGEFIHVPDAIARGTTADQPQTALENWSNANNVFQFVRVEDMDYDPDNPRVVYFADTGSTRIKEGPNGRLIRAATTDFPFFDTNGRVFKMVLNANDPTVVDSLSIHAEGRLVQQDAGPITTVIQAGVGFLNPDNLDAGHASLMVQEDAANAKVWRNDFAATWTHVGTVNHPTAPSAGESSGIVDLSRWLGAGWWALDVQSHVNQSLDPTMRTYTTPITGVVLNYQLRREDGQLMLLYVPGS
jgi:Alkaline phosphatase PhoX